MEITQKTEIKMTEEEFNIIIKLLHSIYDIRDTDEYLGCVMSDIYNAIPPVDKETEHLHEGYKINVIITR